MKPWRWSFCSSLVTALALGGPCPVLGGRARGWGGGLGMAGARPGAPGGCVGPTAPPAPGGSAERQRPTQSSAVGAVAPRMVAGSPRWSGKADLEKSKRTLLRWAVPWLLAWSRRPKPSFCIFGASNRCGQSWRRAVLLLFIRGGGRGTWRKRGFLPVPALPEGWAGVDQVTPRQWRQEAGAGRPRGTWVSRASRVGLGRLAPAPLGG